MFRDKVPAAYARTPSLWQDAQLDAIRFPTVSILLFPLWPEHGHDEGDSDSNGNLEEAMNCYGPNGSRTRNQYCDSQRNAGVTISSPIERIFNLLMNPAEDCTNYSQYKQSRAEYPYIGLKIRAEDGAGRRAKGRACQPPPGYRQRGAQRRLHNNQGRNDGPINFWKSTKTRDKQRNHRSGRSPQRMIQCGAAERESELVRHLSTAWPRTVLLVCQCWRVGLV